MIKIQFFVYIEVRDFEKLEELWAGRDSMPDDVLWQEVWNTGTQLINELELPIAIEPLNEDQSVFFKKVNENVGRKTSRSILDNES